MAAPALAFKHPLRQHANSPHSHANPIMSDTLLPAPPPLPPRAIMTIPDFPEESLRHLQASLPAAIISMAARSPFLKYQPPPSLLPNFDIYSPSPAACRQHRLHRRPPGRHLIYFDVYTNISIILHRACPDVRLLDECCSGLSCAPQSSTAALACSQVPKYSPTRTRARLACARC